MGDVGRRPALGDEEDHGVLAWARGFVGHPSSVAGEEEPPAHFFGDSAVAAGELANGARELGGQAPLGQVAQGARAQQARRVRDTPTLVALFPTAGEFPTFVDVLPASGDTTC